MWTFVDLFAGASGLGCGMRLRFEHLLGIDVWDDALQTSRLNGLNMAKIDLNDVRKAVATILPLKPDVICGGSPCQSFSQCSNKYRPELAELTIKFAKIVSKVQPRLFVLENTPNAPRFKCYDCATRILQKAGYDILRVKIDASRCGSPQHRVRIFQIGVRATEHSARILGHEGRHVARRMRCGKRAVLGDVLPSVDGLWHYPRNYAGQSVYGPHEVFPTIRTMCLTPPPTPRSRLYYVQPVQNYCPVARATVPTIKMIAKIQGFPHNYRFFAPNRKSIELQLGNSVPVQLGRYVARIAHRVLTRVEGSPFVQREGVLIAPDYAIPRK